MCCDVFYVFFVTFYGAAVSSWKKKKQFSQVRETSIPICIQL